MKSEVVRRRLLVVAVLAVAAGLLVLPVALSPVRLNDSWWIDWVWLDQFAGQLRNGVIYPRWLPMSHGGLGSPVFYYYPPLAFYAGSIFVLVGLPVYCALIATFFAAYLLSGVGMYLWLRDEARWPLLGALVYVLAPYHACDFYLRGALAESLAAAILPFVMWGVARIKQGTRDGFAIAAASYAALIGSHLPLALLASLFLIGPYALIHVRKSPHRLLRVGGALATGVALAAVYLLPALMLEPYRDTVKLWEYPNLQPQNWTFWNQPMSKAYFAMLAIGVALAIPSLAFALIGRSRWAAFALLCVLLGIGLVPIFWTVPLLRSVQFPFRILTLAEFGLATAVASAALGPALGSLVLFPVLLVEFVNAVPGSENLSMQMLVQLHPDVPENLPPGPRPYGWPSRWALALAAEHPGGTVVNGTTIDTVFYFPGWQVRCGGQPVSPFPDPQTRLLAYRGQSCTRALGLTRPEKGGIAISLLGLLALVGAALRSRASVKPAVADSSSLT